LLGGDGKHIKIDIYVFYRLAVIIQS